MNPISLGQCPLPYHVATFKEIPIRVACECLDLYLRSALNVWGNKNPDLDDFETADSDEASIIVWNTETIFEKRRTRTWESKQDIRRDGRADMLMFRFKRDVGVANFKWPGQEIPAV